MTLTADLIDADVLQEAMSYSQYREMIDRLLEEGRTTGTDHSEAMVEYTRMNVQRMKRLDRQVEIEEPLEDRLRNLDRPMIWLVLTEAWCGDAAQNLPVLAAMARQSDEIELKLILRDEHPEIMDAYLTGGSRSIPKLICLDAETLEELGTWGPRPEVIQEKAMQWKDDEDLSKEAWAEKVHKWYAKDRGRELLQEFAERLESWQQA